MVAVLAIGLGATTAAFRVVHAALIAPLPYADADRLVMVFERNVSRGRARNVINPGNFFTWSERTRTLDSAGVFSPSVGNLAGDGATPEELPAMVVQASVLAMTGVRPEAGRLFTALDEDPSSPRVVLIDGGLWRRRFGAAPDAVGRTIVFNGEPATIVGVLPPTFHVAGYRGDLWRPALIPAGARTSFRGRSLLSLARLGEGVTREQAEAELNGIFATLVDEHPEMNTGWDLSVVSVRDQVGSETRPALLALFGAVGAVLLVACANIAALLLVRATARRHDLAVRVTLGAGPGQIARQVAVECLTLFAAGGVLGAVVAAVLTQVMWRAAYDAGMVLESEGGLNGPALAFAGGLTLLTGLACSLGPALRARRLSPDDLKAGGRSVAAATRGRGWLVAGEVAAAMLVLSGAALLGRSYMELQAVDPGFQADRVITARVSRMGAAAQASSVGFTDEVIDRVRALPGVTSAAATSFLPLDGQLGIGSSFWLGDRPDPGPGNKPVADYRPVTPGYFATLGIRLVAGRDFSAQDVEDRPRSPSSTRPSCGSSRPTFPHWGGASWTRSTRRRRSWASSPTSPSAASETTRGPPSTCPTPSSRSGR
ncbi:MAG: ABC transporter permease [Vicinamibacterales bacterium]